MPYPKLDATESKAQALRDAGLVPVRQIWVTPEDRDLILWLAKKHMPTIRRALAKGPD
jgi:hypothetical protein